MTSKHGWSGQKLHVSSCRQLEETARQLKEQPQGDTEPANCMFLVGFEPAFIMELEGNHRHGSQCCGTASPK